MSQLINLARVVIRSGPKAGARLGPLTPKMIERSAHLRQTRHGLETVRQHLTTQKIRINPTAMRSPIDVTKPARRARMADAGFDRVVYHGTSKDIRRFKIGSPGYNSTIFGSEPTTRVAAFTAESREFAREFANQGRRKGKVMPLVTNAQNPFDASKYGFGALPDSFFEKHKLNSRYLYNLYPADVWKALDVEAGGRHLRRALMKEGYDSIKLMDVSSGDVANTTALAVFRARNLRRLDADFDPRKWWSSNLKA